MSQNTDTDEDLSIVNDEEVDSSQVIKDEKARVSLLDNAIASILKDKIVMKDGGVSVNMTPKELRDITAAQKDLNEMRRKTFGFGE
jgi:hypothetical protein